MRRGSRRLAMSGSIATSVIRAPLPAALLALGRAPRVSARLAPGGVGRGAALRRHARLGVRLVAAAPAPPPGSALAAHLEPSREIARQLRVTVATIGLRPRPGGRGRSRPPTEDGGGITGVGGR